MKQNTAKSQAESINVKEPSTYYSEDEHSKITTKINEIVVADKLNDGEISRNEKVIKDLETGSICPFCKRPLEGVDHSNEINETKNHILRLKESKVENESSLNKLREEEKVFVNLKKEYDEYEKNKIIKAKYELSVDQISLEITKSQTRLDSYDKNKLKHEHNQKVDGEIVILKTKIETARADIKTANASVEKHKSNITVQQDKIKVNLDLIKKIKQEEELISTFKIYLTIFGKNGISKVIMKNMIPLLNQELHRLLQDSCYFSLELNINEKLS